MMHPVEELKSQLSIRRVAAYFGLSPGRGGLVRCPFHQDRTPSLKLYDATNSWYCFGCGRGGSVIDLMMEREHLTFPAACRALDGAFGLGLYGVQTPEALRQRRERAAALRAEAARRQALQDQRARQGRVLAEYRRWLQDQPPSRAREFDLAYVDRLLDQEKPPLFDAAARVRALLGKHPNGGEFHFHA